jgi:hypothetical protein
LFVHSEGKTQTEVESMELKRIFEPKGEEITGE